jgi:molecular chaperone DnaJ
MADKKDYYESLGVSKTATDAEIKSAFRKLAKKYHPDNKETGDEAKFKEIGEAYSVLSDKQKRAQYDQFGHAAFQNGGAGGFGGGQGFSGFGFDDIDLSDLFNMFGGGFGGSSRSSSRGSAKTKGRDIETNIEISFDDAVYGCEKILKVSKLFLLRKEFLLFKLEFIFFLDFKALFALVLLLDELI